MQAGCRGSLVVCAVLSLFAATTDSRAAEAQTEPKELIITEDTVLDPDRTYGRIVIKASNVTLDGRGAWCIGPGGDAPNTYRGTAVTADGVSGVTLRNLNAKGWETGLHVRNGSKWTVTGCDFSDNFHDPEFGWGENGRRGGIVFERVSDSTIRKTKANRVWDACVLVECNGNVIAENDFSRTSNTCLKLWTSSRNRVLKNNLSYGLRIRKDEVHARDSTCVLIESGSNDNHFADNDCTHGGDGIFIRVLNHWVSTGNVFERNDCSFANNNCVEAWSPRNTWIENKANHGSYGFWLGASDQNVLLRNVASFNGLPDGFHNSPHLPDRGHAGIVFMFGPSSHTILRDNVCEGNNGAGIAAIGDLESQGKKWNAFHWIVEQNTLKANRWGIYLQHADMFDLAGNRFTDNSVADVFDAGNVTGLVRRTLTGNPGEPPQAELHGPTVAHVGNPVTFDARGSRSLSGRPLAYRWRIAPDVSTTEPTLSQQFTEPGFRRLALTVDDGQLSDLAWRDLYVIDDLPEIGTENAAAAWDWIDPQSKVTFTADQDVKLVGNSSLKAHVQPYGGGRVTLRLTVPEDAGDLTGKTSLVFWLKTRNEHVPAWQDVNPLLTLTDRAGETSELKPTRDFLSQPPYIEAREGWTYFAVPLAGNDDWQRTGTVGRALQSVSFGFDSWGAPPLTVWIDGLGLK